MLQIEIINSDTLTRFNKEHRTHYLFPNKIHGSTNVRFENVLKRITVTATNRIAITIVVLYKNALVDVVSGLLSLILLC